MRFYAILGLALMLYTWRKGAISDYTAENGERTPNENQRLS